MWWIGVPCVNRVVSLLITCYSIVVLLWYMVNGVWYVWVSLGDASECSGLLECWTGRFGHRQNTVIWGSIPSWVMTPVAAPRTGQGVPRNTLTWKKLKKKNLYLIYARNTLIPKLGTPWIKKLGIPSNKIIKKKLSVLLSSQKKKKTQKKILN